MGEKFAANPVTGTGSMSVPLATSPGRSGLGPQLSLAYDSGERNGPFGFGWNLSLPSITRKTDKGLPRYQDTDDSDVFILSGTEDLVPEFKKGAKPGEWAKDANGNFIPNEVPRDGYLVRRYRLRIKGLFARIERWTSQTNPTDVFWRSIFKDNIAEGNIESPVHHARPNAIPAARQNHHLVRLCAHPLRGQNKQAQEETCADAVATEVYRSRTLWNRRGFSEGRAISLRHVARGHSCSQ